MKLAIPQPPRPVTLRQVPGAFLRIGLMAVALVMAMVLLWGLTDFVGRRLSAEAAFLGRAVQVTGTVVGVVVPPVAERDGATGQMSALFTFDERQISASRIEVDARQSEGLGRGNEVRLLVDPQDLSHPKDARLIESRLPTRWLIPLIVGLGGAVALLVLIREFRKVVQGELEPLKNGLMVWLTPDEPLPETREETTFKASYWRNDQQFRVLARARPGRAVVKNGDKVLAALVPGKESWVRVIDEDLARSLGWF